MNFKIGSVEIKTREILTSIAIICVLLVVGILISNTVEGNINKTNEKYRLAIKVDNDSKAFQHLFATSGGNVLAYGEVIAINPVTNPEINGEYFSITKRIEEWEEWDEYVTERDSKGNTTTKVIHHEDWQFYKEENNFVNQFSFLGTIFSTSKLSFPEYSAYNTDLDGYGETQAEKVYHSYFYERDSWPREGDLRWSYSVIPKSYFGTSLVFLQDNNMVDALNSKDTINFEEISIADKMKNIENSSKSFHTVFNILWTILILGTVIIFIIADNQWLDDKKNRR